MRVLKLYFTPCPVAKKLLKCGSHIGFKVKDDSICHVFKLESDYKPRIEGKDVKVSLNSTSKCIFLETRKCIVRELLTRFYLVNFKVHRDRVIAVVIIAGKNWRIPNPEEYGPCLISVEEIKPEDLVFNEKEYFIAREFLESGYFKYRRRSKLESLAANLGYSKSQLSYILRRIVGKALAQIV
ncbi:MAG: helix-turn-helix domain-containing protein [Desulfurococcales archaeon]|nr:helix-turn-helix domain-containing protein [Desulfurococcales archaeon]